MNLIIIIWEFIKYVAMGLWTGFTVVFEALPLYEKLSGLKEEIVAAGLGVPTIIISIICTIPAVVRITFKIIKQFE